MSVNLPAGVEPFLASAGWSGAAIEPLAGDASFRRYFRIRQGENTAMLMDAPPPNEDPQPFLRAARWLDGNGMRAGLRQLVDLVLHQRDQRRDDHRTAGQREGGQLVAQRFASAGRHDGEGGPVRQHVRDHGLLAGAQLRQAEDAPQRAVQRHPLRRLQHGEPAGLLQRHPEPGSERVWRRASARPAASSNALMTRKPMFHGVGSATSRTLCSASR